jgi:general nucleoside transport system ATP-binding protein
VAVTDVTDTVAVDLPAENGEIAVSMRGITKRFGSLAANDEIDFDLWSGEIHALIGENGAGKTTLMNVLAGLLEPDEGEVDVFGRPVLFRDPHDASRAGIGMVHQHFKLVPTLSVVENVLLGDCPEWHLSRALVRRVAKKLAALSDAHGLALRPTSMVRDLSVGEQQRVEVLRAIYRGARILILDEPTANLAKPEAERLLQHLRGLAAHGSSIVVITHHLDEAVKVADRVTVLRHGRHVATLPAVGTDVHELARLMVGRSVSLALGVGETDARGPRRTPGRTVLDVRALSVVDPEGRTRLEGVSFAVAEGEVVAIAGVEGNGQAELESVLTGLLRASDGRVSLDGEDLTDATPARLLARGVGIVASERYGRGLIGDLSVAENLVLDRIGAEPYGRWYLLRRREINGHGQAQIQRFSIKATAEMRARSLSGGHAQRVVLARALSEQPRLLVAAQPSRGLDVGAIEFVWETIDRCRENAGAVLLISTDLEEILALADRCHVLFRGRIVATFERAELDRERIGAAMGGLEVSAAQAGGS